MSPEERQRLQALDPIGVLERVLERLEPYIWVSPESGRCYVTTYHTEFGDVEETILDICAGLERIVEANYEPEEEGAS
jgi:hypothetical protein